MQAIRLHVVQDAYRNLLLPLPLNKHVFCTDDSKTDEHEGYNTLMRAVTRESRTELDNNLKGGTAVLGYKLELNLKSMKKTYQLSNKIKDGNAPSQPVSLSFDFHH